MPNQQLPPQQLGRQVAKPRAKKALTITDKDGNPIDLSGVKKSGSKPAAAAAATAKESDASAPSDSAKPTDEKTAAVTTVAPPPPQANKDMDAGAKMRQLAMERIQGKAEKQEEEKPPAEAEKPKEATPEPKKEAAPEPKKEIAPEPKKEESQPKKSGGGSLASMLAKQEIEKEKEEKNEVARGGTNLKVNADGKKRHVYSKEEMMR